MSFSIENDYVKYVIDGNGRNLHFIDKRTGVDYCLRTPKMPLARVKKMGREYDASRISTTNGRITVQFGRSGISAVITVKPQRHYFVIEVLSVIGGGVEELVFANLHLTLQGKPREPFAGCILALNLQTKVEDLPRAQSRLRASCYPRFSFAGAKAALIGCPQEELRQVMKEVVSDALELPHSPLGGPWAMEPEINRGSYLFNFKDLSEETVDDWIKLAQTLGMNQIDFHGGVSFRFGDCQPNQQTYPRGLASLKAVVDRLHAAGIAAGLHTYAFFIAKTCPWVTPLPDPRLGKDATFTLAKPLTPDAPYVPIVESTEKMSTITGFFVRNSVTLQIDDELITYSGISKEPPYAFTGCQRGAYGTSATSHVSGAKVHHLKECFGLFTPDGDSTLLTEIAAKTAETFNECGFDMMYLDALDGEDILGGTENGWHYGSKYVFELWKRLKKPALMEMSTFHHHLWFVRSRMGAWDHPNRSHKKFIDLHCAANEECRRIFLPAELGWWAFKTWSGAQGEPTFSDDIEYLCCKCLATDSGFALMGITPQSLLNSSALQRSAFITKKYEELRHASYFPESVKAKLRAPGQEFKLVQNPTGKWQFQPVQYIKHKVEGIDGWSDVWQISNRFARQPLRLRIEALMSAQHYDTPEGLTVADFSDPCEFTDRAVECGVTAEIKPSSDVVRDWAFSGCYAALNTCSENVSEKTQMDDKFSLIDHGLRSRRARHSGWAKVGKRFTPPLNLSEKQALGVWVYGDGQGELLNFQLESPKHISGGIGDHYVIIDFKGWRYFELIEPEGERFDDYTWPYGEQVYHIYRESVNFKHVESLSLWYNNLPVDKPVTCFLSPIKAIPLMQAKLKNPAFTIGGRTVVFPVEMESGCYLEFYSVTDCKLYGPQGELISEVMPLGEVPIIEEGLNQLSFICEASPNINARARVTVITEGKPLRD